MLAHLTLSTFLQVNFHFEVFAMIDFVEAASKSIRREGGKTNAATHTYRLAAFPAIV